MTLIEYVCDFLHCHKRECPSEHQIVLERGPLKFHTFVYIAYTRESLYANE